MGLFTTQNNENPIKNIYISFPSKKDMNKWSELLLGLILVIGAIIVAFYSQWWSAWGISFNFWSPAWTFFKGGIFWFVAMIGVLFILLGISDLKG